MSTKLCPVLRRTRCIAVAEHLHRATAANPLTALYVPAETPFPSTINSSDIDIRPQPVLVKNRFVQEGFEEKGAFAPNSGAVALRQHGQVEPLPQLRNDRRLARGDVLQLAHISADVEQARQPAWKTAEVCVVTRRNVRLQARRGIVGVALALYPAAASR
eukprot:COSAG06_NODE_18441_length_888_cov_0.711027_2_plen_160_part_00